MTRPTVRNHIIGSLLRHPWLTVLALLCGLASLPLMLVDGAVSHWATTHQCWLRTGIDQIALFGKGNVTFLAAVGLGAAGRRRTAIRILLALLLLLPIIWPMKHFSGRSRPNGNNHSFPSGDAATAAVLVAPMSSLPGGLPVALGITATVAARRVLLEYHWPSDVAAGVAIGLLAGVIATGLSRPNWRGLARPWWVVLLAAGTAGMSLPCFEHWDDIRLFAMVAGPGLGLWISLGWLRWASRRWPAWRRRWSVRPGSWRMLIGAAVLVTLIYLLLATPATVWDRDEPRYTKATMEMIASGNWLVPTYDSQWRLHKPVGIYWLMAGSRLVVGDAEVAFRLPSVLATGLSLLLTARIARRLLGRTAAAWTVLVLASCTLMTIVGTLATTAAVLLALILAAMNLVVDELQGRRGWHRPVLLGLAMAGAMLVKGPVGPAVAGAVVVVAGLLAWWSGAARIPGVYWLRMLLAAGVAAGGFLAWAIPANRMTDGGIWRVMVMEHVVERSLRPREGHGGDFWISLPYYLPVLLVGMFPWSGLLPSAASAVAGRRLGGGLFRAVAVGWLVPMLVIVSVAATKLPHYILPVFPVMAMAVGAVLARPDALAERERRWLARSNWLLVPLALSGAAALLSSPFVLVALANTHGLPDLPELAEAGLSLGLVLLAMGVLAMRLPPVRRLHLRAVVLTAGIGAFCVSLLVLGLPVIERCKPSRPIARAIHRAVGPDVPVATSGYDEDSLHFYLGRPDVRTLGPGAIAQWADRDGPGVLVVTRRRWDEAREIHGRDLDLPLIAEREGFQIAKGRWVRLLAFGRNLPADPPPPAD